MFPKIEYIDDILREIEGKKEFRIKDNGTFLSVTYDYQGPDTFSSELLRECRGIKFSKKGSLLARPYHKFFNLGERISEEQLDVSRVSVKYDGSMIHPIVVEGKIRFATKAGLTETSKMAEEDFFRKREVMDFCELHMGEGRTPIFEYCGPRNRIVIKYEYPILVLLDIRENVSGRYLDREEWGSYYCKSGTYNIKDLNKISEEKSIEGVVITQKNGDKVKLKSLEYLRLHYGRSMTENASALLKLCILGGTDDILPLLDKDKRLEISTLQKNVNIELSQIFCDVQEFVREERHTSRKEFAEKVKKDMPRFMQTLCFIAFDNKLSMDSLREVMTRYPEIIVSGISMF